MDSYSADGLTFEVTDAGPADGEVIVLLHGYPETRASWDRVIPLLADEGYRVLAPDQRGYSPGARPRGRRKYRLENMARDVLALADAADAERFHVVGHDWGAGVAWGLAGWHPERIASMTSLASPHGRALMRAMVTSDQVLRSWYVFFYQLPLLPEMAITTTWGRRTFRRTLHRSGLDEERIDQYLLVLAQPGAATAAINWYRAMPLLPPSKWTAPIEVPTLYIYGARDRFLGRKAAELTARYVTGPYQFEVLEDASHWLPEEVPDRVAGLVLDHVRVHGAKV